MSTSTNFNDSQKPSERLETRAMRKRTLMGAAGSLALIAAIAPLGTAHAQGAAVPEETAPKATSQADAGEITVTGSRIVRDGFQAPTPVNVLGAADIQAQKPANIADLVYTMPSVAPGFTAAVSAGNISTPNAGINSVNLRYLGASRTLVLLNGQRTVASYSSGIVDVNTIPQDLVERVEVVTGGASAQYGSDAVAGVVNFILNERYKGLKLSADTGITNYGDGANYRFSATAGLSLLDDRLHILMNGEYYHQDPVNSASRPWEYKGYALINNPNYVPGNGQPQLYVGSNIGSAVYAPGGLIRAVLRNGNSVPSSAIGTYFVTPGIANPLNFGAMSAASSPFMIGGDWRTTMDGLIGTESVQPRQSREGVFIRPSFDISDRVTIYGQFSWNRSQTRSEYARPPQSSVILAADNGYLVTQYPQIATAIAAAGGDSFRIGTSNAGFGVTGTDVTRDVYRYVLGAKGELSLFGHDWKWDAYYQHGLADSYIIARNVWDTARMALAQDAVVSNGQIVCRSTLTNPGNGCVPINRLGTTGPSAAALAYVYTSARPSRDEVLKQDVASVSASGEVFNLPAGAVSVALGAEWRKEQVNAVADLHNTVWLYGNYGPLKGSYTVKESFLEVDIPVFSSLSINAAGRYTDYSTSGTVGTWKVGGIFTPIPDVKFRATYSHDIRAPNLQELFAGASGTFNFVTLPSNTPAPGVQPVFDYRGGNPNLKAETANTLTVGAVFTPSFLPGFSASVDYYDIKMRNNIGSLEIQQIVDFCYSGVAPQLCNAIHYSGNVLQQIDRVPYNFGSSHQTGLDFELSYGRPMLGGNLSIHGQATYYIKNVYDNLVFPVDYAGQMSTSVVTLGSPSLHYRISATYDRDPISVNLVAHGVNSSVYGNDFVECTNNCPASSTQFRTINNNRVGGALYLDGSVTFKVPSAGHEFKLSFIVKNMLNKDPVPTGFIGPSGGYESYPQTTTEVFDTLGRVFRVAATVQF